MMDAQKKILIADDEEDITWAISKSIANSRFGFDIQCVNNGDRAFELLCEERFDLVISDIRMPGRDGLQLILDIRKRHPDTKIIIMTAYGSEEIMERADTLGSFFYIEKPFDMGYLKQLILQALGVKEEGFEGKIDNAGIRELIELNCASKGNSSLLVSRKEENGAIYFKNGAVIHAECGKLMGERALFNILNWGKGTFKIDHNVLINKRTILRDWKTLLHQCV